MSPNVRIKLLVLVGLAFTLRVVFLDRQSLWRDEIDALNFAIAPWNELTGNFLRPGWNGPLYFLLLRVWVAAAGRTAFALRFFSLVWGVLEVPLIYVLGKRHFSPRVARWAALLATFSPYLIWYAAEVKMYTWVPLLVLLVLYALDRACVTPKWHWWAVVVLGTSLAVYSHILAALSIPVLVVWWLFRPVRHSRAWIGAVAALAFLTLPYLPLLAWQLPMALRDRGVTGFPSLTFLQMAGTLLVGWSTGVPGIGRIVGLWTGAGLAAWGAFAQLWHGRWRAVGMLVAWLCVPLVIIWWLSLRGPLFTDRYLIWLAPAYYLLIGTGLAAISRRWLSRTFLVVLLLLAVANIYAQAFNPYKPQFREAAAQLRLRRLPDELLIFQIPYNRIMMAYYLPAPLESVVEAPYTNFRDAEGRFTVTPENVAEQLELVTQGYRQVWLVYSEAPLWDERELVRSWLDAAGVVVYEQHFLMVSLICYKLG
ncbi:MAG: glycosyltransferase family 39 protein [Anaerolineae bacterium]|nr:glycosyltransferase family 39 protein [Anaerolineae bacterium]